MRLGSPRLGEQLSVHMAVSSFWDQYWAVHVTLVAVTEACKVIVLPHDVPVKEKSFPFS